MFCNTLQCLQCKALAPEQGSSVDEWPHCAAWGSGQLAVHVILHSLHRHVWWMVILDWGFGLLVSVRAINSRWVSLQLFQFLRFSFLSLCLLKWSTKHKVEANVKRVRETHFNIDSQNRSQQFESGHRGTNGPKACVPVPYVVLHIWETLVSREFIYR